MARYEPRVVWGGGRGRGVIGTKGRDAFDRCMAGKKPRTSSTRGPFYLLLGSRPPRREVMVPKRRRRPVEGSRQRQPGSGVSGPVKPRQAVVGQVQLSVPSPLRLMTDIPAARQYS